jgi:DNA invertase Pin-like site-specific DNA recombinase
MGHTIVAEYVDTESGGKGADKRPRLAAMLSDAHRRKFDLVAVWAIDRLTREGMAKTVAYLSQLSSAGVAFHSFTEPALCSDNEMVRDILLAVMATLARAERQKISERTKAGLARVRAHGSRSGLAIGRPTIDDKLLVRIRTMKADNPTMAPHAIGKAVGVDRKTVVKYLGS